MQQRNYILRLSSKANTQIKRDRKKRFTRKSVLKMLAVMEASQSTPGPSTSTQVPVATPEEQAAKEKEFLSSGRTGRRNALPDILAANFIIDPDIEDTSNSESNEEDKECPPNEDVKQNKENITKAVSDDTNLPNPLIIIKNEMKDKM